MISVSAPVVRMVETAKPKSHHDVDPGGWLRVSAIAVPAPAGCSLCQDGDCPLHGDGR